MNSSQDLTSALNRLAEKHRSSSSASPASFQHLRLHANGSPAPPSIIANGLAAATGTRIGRPPSASPDLFHTSSRGASPDQSGTASSESGIGASPAHAAGGGGANGNAMGFDLEGHSRMSGNFEMNSSQPLFRDDGDDISMPSSSPTGDRRASPSAHHRSGSPFVDHPHDSFGADGEDGPGLTGEAAIQFRDEENSEADDEDDLWGSPSNSRRSPSGDSQRRASLSSPHKGRSAQKQPSRATAGTSIRIPTRPNNDPSTTSRSNTKEARMPRFWIDVPPLSNRARRKFTIVNDFKPEPSSSPLKSKRAAAAGAKEKNRRLAELTMKPLVISDDESGDETKSAWFDPQKRKQTFEQRKRRADPSTRGERAQERSSQRLDDSASDDASSSESFERLKINLSQIPTVPTRLWGTPEPEDASQGLRAAPKENAEAGPSGGERFGTSSTPNTSLSRPPPAKKAPKKPEGSQHTFEELFMQQSSTSSDEVEVLPSGGRTLAKGKAPAPNRSSDANRHVREESDDDFVPITRPDDQQPSKQSRASTSQTNKPGPGRSHKPAGASMPAVGPNGQRIFPKPAQAPLPSIPLKLPANMHPPTGMVLSREEYEKEDRKRKKRADPTTNGAGKKVVNRKRQRSSDSERGGSPERGHRGAGRSGRNARSDSDDFEVVGSTRQRNRTPPSGSSRPKARALSGSGRARRDSLSPPRRYSGGGSARRRDRSITPSSASEAERARRRKGEKGRSSAPNAGARKNSKDAGGPVNSRSFVMSNSQPPPKKKLKSFTINRDKILGQAAEGRKSTNAGSERASGSQQQQRQQPSGGMDYGAVGDTSDDDDEGADQRRPAKSISPGLKTRNRAREEGSDDEEVRKNAPKILRSEMNEDAWVYTAGTHTREVFRDDLGKLLKARDKVQSQRSSKEKGKGKAREKGKGKGKRAAGTTSDSDTSDTYAASTGESSLSSESKFRNKAPLTDFVIDDDDEPIESLSRRVPRQLSQPQPRGSQRERERSRRSPPPAEKKKKKKQKASSSGSKQRRRRRDSFSEDDSDGDSDGGGREMQPSDYIRLERGRVQEEQIGMTLDDAYWWEMVWLILHLLDLKLPPDDLRKANHARRMLQERMSDGTRSLSNMAVRKNFRWYLKTYPRLVLATLTNEQLTARIDRHGYGCGMCRRTKQKPESRICLYGRPYGPELNVREKEEISSSDCDSEQQDEVKEKAFGVLPGAGNGKKNHTIFYLGSKCALRAELLHRVLHWEVLALDETKKLCSDRLDEWADRDLKQVLEEVQLLVNSKWRLFKLFCERMRTEAMDFDREGG
ncbi:hypothetical protein CF319_g235 [Tilletia indica]|nr:hypothetical protein CF319_g235 [Tilletia indica]